MQKAALWWMIYRNYLTYFNILLIIIRNIAETKMGNSKRLSLAESCRMVQGSSVNSQLAPEFFC